MRTGKMPCVPYEADRRARRRRIKLDTAACGIFLFFVLLAVGNIFVLDFSFSGVSRKFLRAYAAGGDGLRFLDDDNAVLSVGSEAFYCRYVSAGRNTYSLSAAGDGEEAARSFTVRFAGDAAEVRETGGSYAGEFAVTDSVSVPAGVWSHFAYETDDGQGLRPAGEDAWIYLDADGTCYTSDSIGEAYRAEIVACGDMIFILYYEPNGQVSYVNKFDYYPAGGAFAEWPTIRSIEHGDEQYWFRLLSPDELYGYEGGTFTAKAVSYECYNEEVSPDEYDCEDAPWKLLPCADVGQSLLDVTATLTLNKDGSARLRIDGDGAYRTDSGGTWHNLENGILVLLDESNRLTGAYFTVYEGYTDSAYPSDDETLAACALTETETADFYRLGYYKIWHYMRTGTARLYWGADWNPRYILPELILDVPYAAHVRYCPDYYADRNAAHKCAESHWIESDLDMYLVFRDDGRAYVYTDGAYTDNLFYYEKHDAYNDSVKFIPGLTVYFGHPGYSSADTLYFAGASLRATGTQYREIVFTPDPGIQIPDDTTQG